MSISRNMDGVNTIYSSYLDQISSKNCFSEIILILKAKNINEVELSFGASLAD